MHLKKNTEKHLKNERREFAKDVEIVNDLINVKNENLK